MCVGITLCDHEQTDTEDLDNVCELCIKIVSRNTSGHCWQLLHSDIAFDCMLTRRVINPAPGACFIPKFNSLAEVLSSPVYP